jgi:hypothetical protein
LNKLQFTTCSLAMHHTPGLIQCLKRINHKVSTDAIIILSWGRARRLQYVTSELRATIKYNLSRKMKVINLEWHWKHSLPYSS